MAASWYIPAQSTPAARAVLAESLEHDRRAPYCFRFELQNLVLSQERRGALPKQAAEQIWANLMAELDIACAPPPSEIEISNAIVYARDHSISFYDGLYLLLAIQNDATLVTRDARLAEGAAREGCSVYDVAAAT